VLVKEEVGRGELVRAVWAITGGRHDTAPAACRDSELVRMSRAAFKLTAAQSPFAVAKLLGNMARRMAGALGARRCAGSGPALPAGWPHPACLGPARCCCPLLPGAAPDRPSAVTAHAGAAADRHPQGLPPAGHLPLPARLCG
jgi:lysophospholipid hydrolase